MKNKIVARSQSNTLEKQQIIQLCFDAKSIDQYSPGLKMIFALDDPPLFVNIEAVDFEPLGYRPH